MTASTCQIQDVVLSPPFQVNFVSFCLLLGMSIGFLTSFNWSCFIPGISLLTVHFYCIVASKTHASGEGLPMHPFLHKRNIFQNAAAFICSVFSNLHETALRCSEKISLKVLWRTQKRKEKYVSYYFLLLWSQQNSISCQISCCLA